MDSDCAQLILSWCEIPQTNFRVSSGTFIVEEKQINVKHPNILTLTSSICVCVCGFLMFFCLVCFKDEKNTNPYIQLMKPGCVS